MASELPKLNTGHKLSVDSYLAYSMRQALQMMALGRLNGARDLLEVALHTYNTAIDNANNQTIKEHLHSGVEGEKTTPSA